MVVDPRRTLATAAFCLTAGCFSRVHAGYGHSFAPGASGARIELSAGAGDVRARPAGAIPGLVSADLVGDLAPGAHRLGLGLSAAWLPIAGWRHGWTPLLRLGGRVAQAEWFAGSSAASLSGVGEVGALIYAGPGTRGRSFYTVSLTTEALYRLESAGPGPGWRLGLALGIGAGSSIGPTS